jgi:hypothetical protein
MAQYQAKVRRETPLTEPERLAERLGRDAVIRANRLAQKPTGTP